MFRRKGDRSGKAYGRDDPEVRAHPERFVSYHDDYLREQRDLRALNRQRAREREGRR